MRDVCVKVLGPGEMDMTLQEMYTTCKINASQINLVAV